MRADVHVCVRVPGAQAILVRPPLHSLHVHGDARVCAPWTTGTHGSVCVCLCGCVLVLHPGKLTHANTCNANGGHACARVRAKIE